MLRPAGTKAVDAALLLARMLVPEPMRPGWAAALAMSASRLPRARLLGIDARMELAADRPLIVPDTIVIDGGKVFVSETFTRACVRLGVRSSEDGRGPQRIRRSWRRPCPQSIPCSASMREPKARAQTKLGTRVSQRAGMTQGWLAHPAAWLTRPGMFASAHG